MPAAFTSRSTGSQPDSTIGEKEMMSTLRVMKERTASSCFSGCCSESTKTRSIPAWRAAVLMDSVLARRQSLSLPTWAKPSTMRCSGPGRRGRGGGGQGAALDRLPGHQGGPEDHLLGDAFLVVQDVQRVDDGFLAAGGAGEGGGQGAAFHHFDAAARAGQPVDADHPDPPDAQLQGGPARPVGHGVVLGHDDVHRAVLSQPGGELVLGLVPQPVGHEGVHDGDVAALGDRLLEADAPVQHRRGAGPAQDLDDLPALGPEDRRHVLPGLLADQPVVRADEQGVVEPDHGAVQQDDGDALIGLRDHRGERLGLVGRDDQQVDAGVQQGVHVLDLAAVGVGGVGEHDAQVPVVPRLGHDLVAHVDAPRLGEVGQGHADHVVEGLRARARAGRQRGRAAGTAGVRRRRLMRRPCGIPPAACRTPA